MPITENDLSGVHDGDVLSASGEKIGGVGQIYLDDQSGEPTFVTASTGLFGMSQSFVPLRGARVENGNVIVDFDKTTVKDAPRIDDDGSLSPAEEDQLYAYYGMGTTDVDTADYGTADQSPEPGYATTDRDDPLTGDLRSDDRSDSARDKVEGRPAVVETGTSGPVGHAESDPTTPEAPLAGRDGDDRDDDLGDRNDGRIGRNDDEVDRADRTDRADDGDLVPPTTGESTTAGRGGRLRKWVMTEYEPVKSDEVYVEGQGQPGERSTR